MSNRCIRYLVILFLIFGFLFSTYSDSNALFVVDDFVVSVSAALIVHMFVGMVLVGFWNYKNNAASNQSQSYLVVNLDGVQGHAEIQQSQTQEAVSSGGPQDSSSNLMTGTGNPFTFTPTKTDSGNIVGVGTVDNEGASINQWLNVGWTGGNPYYLYPDCYYGSDESDCCDWTCGQGGETYHFIDPSNAYRLYCMCAAPSYSSMGSSVPNPSSSPAGSASWSYPTSSQIAEGVVADITTPDGTSGQLYGSDGARNAATGPYTAPPGWGSGSGTGTGASNGAANGASNGVTTTPPGSNPGDNIGGAYNGVSVGDFGGRISAFFTDIKNSSLFSTANCFSQNIPDSDSSAWSFDWGSLGTMNYDLSGVWGSNAINLMHSFVLLVCAWIAMRIAVRGRG